MNNSNIPPTGKILYANDIWFQGGSFLPKSNVCFSWLFIKLVNDILDMVSYNKDTFILSVTIVSKEKKMKKISV